MNSPTVQVVILICLIVLHCSQAAVTVSTKLSGLKVPTALRILPDGRILVAEQCGRLLVLGSNFNILGTMLTITKSFDCSTDRGLLGVTEDPQFSTNGYIYIFYTSSIGFIHHRVSRFTVSGNTADPASEVVLIDMDRSDHTGYHNGGYIRFSPDGQYLFISTGDNTIPSNSQTLSSDLGKILRIRKDGSLPADNRNPANGVWAMGLRNPYSFDYNSNTGRLFVNDVGENTDEEINVGIAGGNYGWPICEGPCSPADAALTNPIYYFTHNENRCAITAGLFYYPPANNLPSAYVGKYLFVDFCTGQLFSIDPNQNGLAANSAAALANGLGNPCGLAVDGAGNVVGISNGGTVFIVSGDTGDAAIAVTQQPRDTTVKPGDTATFTATASGGSSSLSYQWQRNGVSIAGATRASYTTPVLSAADSGSFFCCIISSSLSALATRGAVLTVSSTAVAAPTRAPTARTPTVKPSAAATTRVPPTLSPTKRPSGRPSNTPTARPSNNPTARPSLRPAARPSIAPTTRRPTGRPSRVPTGKLSRVPTGKPSRRPTGKPTFRPTGRPSRRPTK